MVVSGTCSGARRARLRLRHPLRQPGHAAEPWRSLSAGEAQTILAAGIALMAVQHCPPAYWTPSAELGTTYGSAAAANAAAIGYPTGASLWLDLENMRPGCGAAAIIAYANAWSRAVRATDYLDGVYYGADCPLTPQQLYLDLITTRYWRALSADAPTVAVRRVCMQQFMQAGQVADIDIDRDVVMADAFGGVPMWLGRRAANNPRGRAGASFAARQTG
jgi:hypothetical protein